MSEIIPTLRSQADLLVAIKQRDRDTSSARWTATESYNAINDAVQRWGQRVTIPLLYSLPNGYTAGTFAYSLPWYIRPPFMVQQRRVMGAAYSGTPIIVDDITVTTWVDIPAWTLEPDGLGGQSIRIDINPLSLDGRIMWYGQNGLVPTTLPVLSAPIGAADTSLTVAAIPQIGPAGYVKIDAEWMAYSGTTVTATTTTLLNLIRGLNGTTATIHIIASPVAWGIAVLRDELYQQLFNQVYANLHNLYLTNAAPAETQNHIFQVRWYQQLADEFWKSYVSPINTQMVLGRRAIGALPRGGMIN